MKINIKNKKGITLVALVVTIIVLVILAGVSINLVLGEEGALTAAKRTKLNIEMTIIEQKEKLNQLRGENSEETEDFQIKYNTTKRTKGPVIATVSTAIANTTIKISKDGEELTTETRIEYIDNGSIRAVLIDNTTGKIINEIEEDIDWIDTEVDLEVKATSPKSELQPALLQVDLLGKYDDKVTAIGLEVNRSETELGTDKTRYGTFYRDIEFDDDDIYYVHILAQDDLENLREVILKAQAQAIYSHFHVDANNDRTGNAEMVSTKGGCYNTAKYHEHIDSCYSNHTHTSSCYTYKTCTCTGYNKQFAKHSYEPCEHGETCFGWEWCGDCPHDKDEHSGNSCTAKVKTRICGQSSGATLTCTIKEGVLEGYIRDCNMEEKVEYYMVEVLNKSTEYFPAIVTKAKPGDYIAYKTGKNYTGDWQVLYNDSTNGLQIISVKSVGNFKIGNNASDREAMSEYNSAIGNLNNFCSTYVNLDYAKSGRCVGTDPKKPSSTGNTITLNFSFKESYPKMLNTDTNYVKDLNAMNTLRIKNIGKAYWLGSCHAINEEIEAIFSVREIDAYGDIGYSEIWSVYPGDDSYPGAYSYNGIRPVITLKQDLRCIGGSGTQEDPYTL